MAFVVGIQLLLGAMGLLFFPYVLAIGFALIGALGVVLRRDPRSGNWTEEQKRFQVAWDNLRGLLQHNAFLSAALLLALTVTATQFVNSLTVHTSDGDTLQYHLPIVVSWLKSGDLGAQSAPLWWYPGTEELVVLWGMLPVRSDLFLGLVNWIFIVLACLSIWGIARKLQITPRWAAFAPLLFLNLPALQKQVGTAKNDIAVAALFLAAVNFSFNRTHQNKQLPWTIVVGLALGLLLGTKYYAIYYITISGILYLVLSKWMRTSISAVMKFIMLVSLTLALGGYWYLRNLWLTGTPLYPMQLAGMLADPNDMSSSGLSHWFDTMLIAHVFTGLGLTTFLKRGLLNFGGIMPALLPFILPMTWISLWRDRRLIGRSTYRDRFLLLVLLPPALLAALLVTPWGAQLSELDQLRYGYTPMRYGLPLWAMGCVATVYLMERFSQLGYHNTTSLAACSAIAFGYVYPGIGVREVLLFCILLIAGVLLDTRDQIARLARLGTVLGLLVALIITVGFSLALYSYRQSRHGYAYGSYLNQVFGYSAAFEWFNSHVTGARVFVMGVPPYGFYGPHLENDVVYSPCPIGEGTIWTDCVLENGIDFIVFGRSSQWGSGFGQFPQEEIFAQIHPDTFKPVYQDDIIHIYQVRLTRQ